MEPLDGDPEHAPWNVRQPFQLLLLIQEVWLRPIFFCVPLLTWEHHSSHNASSALRGRVLIGGVLEAPLHMQFVFLHSQGYEVFLFVLSLTHKIFLRLVQEWNLLETYMENNKVYLCEPIRWSLYHGTHLVKDMRWVYAYKPLIKLS